MRAAIEGKCRLVATFGAAISMNYTSTAPINNYVHTQKAPGCCTRNAFGKCLDRFVPLEVLFIERILSHLHTLCLHRGQGEFYSDMISSLSTWKFPNPILTPLDDGSDTWKPTCSNYPQFMNLYYANLKKPNFLGKLHSSPTYFDKLPWDFVSAILHISLSLP